MRIQFPVALTNTIIFFYEITHHLGGIKDDILNMCATLVALLQTYITLDPCITSADLNTYDAEVLVDSIVHHFQPHLVIQFLKALIFIRWVLSRHPLLFKSLALEKNTGAQTWESFIMCFLVKYKSTIY